MQVDSNLTEDDVNFIEQFCFFQVEKVYNEALNKQVAWCNFVEYSANLCRASMDIYLQFTESAKLQRAKKVAYNIALEYANSLYQHRKEMFK